MRPLFRFLTKPLFFQFTKTLPLFTLKDFYLNRQFAKSLNPLINVFEEEVIKTPSPEALEVLFQQLIDPLEDELAQVRGNIEFFSLILLEKIIVLQAQNPRLDGLPKAYTHFYSLIFTHLNHFRPESLLFLIHIVAREPEANKRAFRIFEFVIMRTAFAAILGEDELMQLVEDCDKFFQVIETDSFLEILEKIEKVLFEKHQKELKFSPENLAKLAFIYSTHRVGSREFYDKIYHSFKQNFEIMVTKELIVILWSLQNSGHFDSLAMIEGKVAGIIENDLEKVEEYYQNMYLYVRKKDSLKYKKPRFFSHF